MFKKPEMADKKDANRILDKNRKYWLQGDERRRQNARKVYKKRMKRSIKTIRDVQKNRNVKL
jgi:hypothetical protein